MLALLIVIAVAAALTFTLSARPAIAIPGGVLATVAWWVAASASVGLMHGLAGVAYTAIGIGTFAFTLADGVRVTRRERRRLAERREQEREERLDYLARHALAVENTAEEAGR